ncbi:Ras-like GTP-binding protein [Lachnellula occidentalis]|uniref:Ras-like GTP-binding protein n=1 Tax=Lachnellula occidentalis TaxID=215460 RepID=A0A8H8UB83_9HELO|nr:Ras-like GTP-binding protein [Lachnellula occidentalis]
MAQSLEAKIVVLGAQGVGKTSLLTRYIKNQFTPASTTSTVGANFLAKKVIDIESDTVVRLQLWDTAGQERFRAISRIYYRGANACILCYSITDQASFGEIGPWLTELRRNLPADIIIHVVGTKADIVARDPTLHRICSGELAPGMSSTPPATATPGQLEPPMTAGGGGGGGGGGGYRQLFTSGSGSGGGTNLDGARSPSSKRSSGFWGQEVGWDCCHEVSAESGEGVEEVFRVITRKLVEQNKAMSQQLLSASQTPGGSTPGEQGGPGDGAGGYFDGIMRRGEARPGGSFRVGRDRRSWFGVPVESYTEQGPENGDAPLAKSRRKCC